MLNNSGTAVQLKEGYETVDAVLVDLDVLDLVDFLEDEELWTKEVLVT
jgi:hypothetical protein